MNRVNKNIHHVIGQNQMNKFKQDCVEQAVQITVQIIELLQSKKKLSYDELSFLYSQVAFRKDIDDERKLTSCLIDCLINANPEMVSRRLVLEKIIFGVIGKAIYNKYNPLPKNEYKNLAQVEIENIVKYESWRQIDIPLVNISVENKLITFKGIQFHNINEIDKNEDWWRKIGITFGNMASSTIISFARINAPGDRDHAIEYANHEINNALLLLRGIGFPITAKEISQIGFINALPFFANQHYKLHQPTENVRMDTYTGVVTQIVHPRAPYSFENDLMKEVTKEIAKDLTSVIEQFRKKPSSRMTAKYIAGLRWLGEATLPDELSSRFVKLAFSLEAFIGGDPKDRNLTIQGLTASLQERTAFLIGNDGKERHDIHKNIGHFYSIRSAIVHGRHKETKDDDFEQFGLLVRNVAFKLLPRLKELKSIDDFQKWIHGKRYAD